MKISVLNEINFYLEAVSILNSYNNKNCNYSLLKERLMQKYNIPSENIDNMLKDIINIYNYVANRLDIPQDKLDFYFSSESTEVPTICELIMFSVANENKSNLDSLIKLDENQKLYNVMRIMFLSLEYDVCIDNFSYVDYINHINNLDIDNETKYKYVLLCCNIDKAFNEVIGYINETVVLLKEKEKELQKIADEFVKITKEDVEKYGDSFFSKYDIQVDIPKNIAIGPSIIIPNNLMINPYNQDNECIYSCMGVCVREINNLKKEYLISDEKTISILKALGDKSKFDILKSIKDKEMYGAEIAKMHNITTATVSHHMSNLYNLSLVNIITNNNRVNYTLNKESIKELINILERIYIK